jgi:hypothetical protein
MTCEESWFTTNLHFPYSTPGSEPNFCSFFISVVVPHDSTLDPADENNTNFHCAGLQARDVCLATSDDRYRFVSKEGSHSGDGVC